MIKIFAEKGVNLNQIDCSKTAFITAFECFDKEALR